MESIGHQEGTLTNPFGARSTRLGKLYSMFIVSCCSFVWLDVFWSA